ncbi:MAG: hypothetical protein U0R24_04535 [Solirubrobacterales bacterium]
MRGTSRGAALAGIEAAGLEAVEADPDSLGTITDLIADVTVLVWLMGGAADAPELNRERLGSLLEKLVDSPVRGLVYEARGSAPAEVLDAGAANVEAWGERFRTPVAVLRADPAEHEAWVAEAHAAVSGLLR